MKYIFIIIVCAVILLSSACPDSLAGSIKPYFSAGEKSQTDGIEERDLSGSFDYYKYGTSINFDGGKSTNLSLRNESYLKDFTSSSHSDVDTYLNKISADFLISDTEDVKLNADLDFSIRNKRYKTSKRNNYDQFTGQAALNYKLKDSYSLKLSGGINNYEYIKNNDADILKTFVKISPKVYMLDKRIELSGFTRIRWLDSETGKDTTEAVFSGSSALNLDFPFIYKIKAGIETGKENTQDTEDREDSLRYKYTKWDTATYHKLNEKIKTQFQYGQKERDYILTDNDYENWYIKNDTDFDIIKKDSFKLSASIGYEHKETDFNKVTSKSYIKNQIASGLSFLKRANWSMKPEFTFTDYDYGPESTSSEKSYKGELSVKKYIGKDVSVEGYYWYKWKDYDNKPNAEQWTFCLSSTTKF